MSLDDEQAQEGEQAPRQEGQQAQEAFPNDGEPPSNEAAQAGVPAVLEEGPLEERLSQALAKCTRLERRCERQRDELARLNAKIEGLRRA